MEALIKNAAIAWNPIGATRARMLDGTLTVGAVIVPFLGVVIACNLFAVSAQKFFYEALLFAMGQELGDHPLLGDFAQRLLAAIGPVVPAVAVAMLPARTFGSVGRSGAAASVFVIAAAWAFYGTAISVPIYFVAGALATVDPDLGWSTAVILQFPAVIVILVLLLFFWFRIFRGVLALPGGSVALISVVGFGSLAALFILAWMAANALIGG